MLATILMACSSMAEFGSANIVRPDEIVCEPVGSAEVAVEIDGKVTIGSSKPLSTVILKWKVDLTEAAKSFGGSWERTYGVEEWAKPDSARPMPWYCLITDGQRTDGYGVQVQPGALASWRVGRDEIQLVLDVRAGVAPVKLGGRTLEACTIVSHRGKCGESAYEAARALCRLMCPRPRLAKTSVYGYNDWYCAYGNNTAENFLADAKAIVELCEGLENRPFVVVDDGWQRSDFRGGGVEPERQWESHNATWGMAMDEFCRRVKAMGARPGLWYRPLYHDKAANAKGIDPTDSRWERQIRSDMKRFREWGIELVKIDFITEDWSKQWNTKLYSTPLGDRVGAWADDSRTTAEVVRGLYRTMRESAGDMYIIGCNALDHFAAGLFELQRTGDDTSGKEWKRTWKMGPHTLGMRAAHNGVFYQNDGDCVGLVAPGLVPWEKNREWLDLVARSGTSLFVSWKRENMDDAVRAALRKAFAMASRPQKNGEPKDWVENPRPKSWHFDTGDVTYTVW